MIYVLQSLYIQWYAEIDSWILIDHIFSYFECPELLEIGNCGGVYKSQTHLFLLENYQHITIYLKSTITYVFQSLCSWNFIYKNIKMEIT